MKKCIILLLSVLLLCTGCWSSSIEQLSEAESVLIDWGSKPLIHLSGDDLIESACENLMSLTLEEVEKTDPMAAMYTLEFYDESEKLLLNLTISTDGLLSFDGKTYIVTAGELDTSWFEFAIAKSSGPPSG